MGPQSLQRRPLCNKVLNPRSSLRYSFPKRTPPPDLPSPPSWLRSSFVQVKRGPEAPTSPTMQHRPGMENYSSREATRAEVRLLQEGCRVTSRPR